MSRSVLFKTKIALSFLVAVVSLGYAPAETKVLKPALVQIFSADTGVITTVETKVLRPVLVDQDCTSRDYFSDEKWCNGLQPYGTACPGPAEVRRW